MADVAKLFLAYLLVVNFCVGNLQFLNGGSGEVQFTQVTPSLNFSAIVPKRPKGGGPGRNRTGVAPVPPPPPLWYEDEKCSRPAASGCSPIEDQTCYGLKLGSHMVETANRELLLEKLERLAKFSGLPHCWEALRDVLCAVYMPNCTELKDSSRVKLASAEMCLEAKKSCKFLLDQHLWPPELGFCNDTNTFASKCHKYEVPLKWPQQDAKCVEPLTNSGFRDGWIFGIESCALNCTSPWLTESQHSQVRRAATVVVVIVLAISIVTAMALMRGSMAKSYPISLRCLFWVFFFYVIICVAWLTPYFLGDQSLTCRKDGSLKFNEPNDSDSHSCPIQFFFLYYSVMAMTCWLVVFTYCQFLSFTEQPAVAHKEISRHRSYFHLYAWAFPLLLFVAVVAMSQIDADGVTGVCFVGYKNPYVFVGFVFAPIMVNWTISFGLIVYSLMKRRRIDHLAKVTLIVTDSDSRCSSMSLKLISLYVILFLVFAGSVVIHIRNYFSLDSKNSDLLDYIICQLSNRPQCELVNRSELYLVQLDIFLLFVPAVMTAMFVWTNGLGTVLKTECVRFRNLCGSGKTHSYHSGHPNGVLKHTEGTQHGRDNYEMTSAANQARRRSLNSSLESCLVAELAGAKPVLSGEGDGSESDSRSKRREIIQRLSRSQRKSSASHRVEDKLRSHFYRLAQRSMTSLNSGRTPSSLRSGPLPSDIMIPGPSLPELAYPEPMRYPPMMDPRMFQAYQSGFMPPYMIPPWMYQYYHQAAMQNAGVPPGSFMPPPGMFPPFYQSPATSNTPGQTESQTAAEGVKSDGDGEKKLPRGSESKTPTLSAMGPPSYGGMFCYPYGPMMAPWGYPPMGNFPQTVATPSSGSAEVKPPSEGGQKATTSVLSGGSKKSESNRQSTAATADGKLSETAKNPPLATGKSDESEEDEEGSEAEQNASLDDGDDSSVDEGEAEFIAAQMRLYQQVKATATIAVAPDSQPLLDGSNHSYDRLTEEPTGSARSLTST